MSKERYIKVTDSMGELEVPQSALWGAQTQRAVNNFPISGICIPRQFIAALGLIKWSAAKANNELGLLSSDKTNAIELACEAIIDGKHDDQFPIDINIYWELIIMLAINNRLTSKLNRISFI